MFLAHIFNELECYDYYDMALLMKRPNVHVLSFCSKTSALSFSPFSWGHAAQSCFWACSERERGKQEVPVLFPLPHSFISFYFLLFMAHAKTCTLRRGQTEDEVVTETRTQKNIAANASGVFIDLMLNSVWPLNLIVTGCECHAGGVTDHMWCSCT